MVSKQSKHFGRPKTLQKKQTIMNDQNLIPNSERTPKEREELARKAGIASGEARRRRKQLRDDLLVMLDEEVEFKDRDGNPMKKRLQESIARKVIKKANEGDLKAVELIAKLTGEFEQRVKLDADVRGVQVVVGNSETAEKLKDIIGE